MRRAILARELPSAASAASCGGRTLMSANSVATKKPFATMKASARRRYQLGMWASPLFYDDLVEGLPEARIRLRDHLLVRDRDVASRESGNGEGHGDAMVVVRLDRCRFAGP